MIPYRTNNSADELAMLMHRAMESEAADKKTNNLKEGLSCLYKAADILDHLQEHQASEAITVIIEKLAGK